MNEFTLLPASSTSRFPTNIEAKLGTLLMLHSAYIEKSGADMTTSIQTFGIIADNANL